MNVLTNVMITFDKVRDKKALDSFMEGDTSDWKVLERTNDVCFMLTHSYAVITDPETFMIDARWEE